VRLRRTSSRPVPRTAPLPSRRGRPGLAAAAAALLVACAGPTDERPRPDEVELDAGQPGDPGAGGRGGGGGGGGSTAPRDARPAPREDAADEAAPRDAAGAGGAGGSGGAPRDAAPGRDAAAEGRGPADGGPPAPDVLPGEGTPTFVAVGYAGRRIRSRDLGKTWTDDQKLGGGGDDEFLLRAVGFGRGLFVAVGWKILTSPDGATWTERSNPNRQWLGGIQFGLDRFAAVGGYGYSAHSSDGVTWSAGGNRGTEPARSLAFGAGKFVANTDDGNWWGSTDGTKWTRETGGHMGAVVFCGTEFKDARACAGPLGRNGGRTAFGAGVYVSLGNGRIERSEDGTTWQTVAASGAGLEAVTFGYAR
jgi:hypothetical protein